MKLTPIQKLATLKTLIMNPSNKLNTILFATMLVLGIPTTAILVSNNAIPGDALYPIKTTVEKVASTIFSPSYEARSDLEIKLIQRRIEENQKLILSSGSTKGLALLVAQAEAAKEYILNSDASQQAKTKNVQKLVATLKQSQKVLEQEKRNFTSNTNRSSVRPTSNPTISHGNPPPNSTPTPRPATQPNQTPNLPTATIQPNTSTPPSSDPIDDIEDSSEQIEEIIQQLESADNTTPSSSDLDPTPTPTPEPTAQPTQNSQMQNILEQLQDRNDDDEGRNNNGNHNGNNGNDNNNLYDTNPSERTD